MDSINNTDRIHIEEDSCMVESVVADTEGGDREISYCPDNISLESLLRMRDELALSDTDTFIQQTLDYVERLERNVVELDEYISKRNQKDVERVAKRKKTTAIDRVLVFDLETTGFPSTRHAKPFYSNCFQNARMIEIAYTIATVEGDPIKHVSRLINVDVKVENSHIHGITNEMLKSDGVNVKDVFQELLDDLRTVSTLVAHNIEFDYKVLLSEVYRAYVSHRDLLGQIYSKKLVCTMKDGQKLMNVRKYPKLKELYEHLHEGEVWEQSHRAGDDVARCLDCYRKLAARSKSLNRY